MSNIQFKLLFTEDAQQQLLELKQDPSKKRIFKDVIKTLKFMQENLRHPSLNTHQYHSLMGNNGEKVFESYAQQATSGAYRIFWYYGPEKGYLSIIAIIQHT